MKPQKQQIGMMQVNVAHLNAFEIQHLDTLKKDPGAYVAVELPSIPQQMAAHEAGAAVVVALIIPDQMVKRKLSKLRLHEANYLRKWAEDLGLIPSTTRLLIPKDNLAIPEETLAQLMPAFGTKVESDAN